jgi:hypothetical protein
LQISFLNHWNLWFKLITSGTQMQKQHAIFSFRLYGNTVATISILVITTTTTIITG